MSAEYLGDFIEDATVHFLWSTNDSNGASITRATDGTVSVYKDNGDAQSVAGITDTEDFDSLTGIHACTIDTSADAFYATGANYSVILSGSTIDGQTVNAVLAHFSIENRFQEVDLTRIAGNATNATNLGTAASNYSATRGLTGTALPAAAADAIGGLPISDAGGLDLDAKLAETNEITAARMGALTDWINDGRLDVILDAIAAGVNVSEWNGSAVATPSIAGVPEVDVTHIAGNAGAANSLKSLTDMIVTSGTAQGPGANSNQIQLAAGEPSVSDIFDPAMILLTGGTGTGQSRRILEYDGSTKIAVVNRTWKTVPDNTTKYSVFADPGGMHVNEGLAQAGAASTITLNALARAENDAYNGQTIFLVSGTGEDQARIVTAYNGTSKIATVNKAWDTTPDTTTAYLMLPLLDCVNIERIGGSTQSATDLKDFADTGYDPDTNKVQGVVLVDTTTDVTNPVTTDATSRTESKADVSALALDATVAALNNITAADVITALKASTGWTAGGTIAFDDLFKALMAAIGGAITKSGDLIPYTDFEDQVTVIFTLDADETTGIRTKV